MYFFILYHVSLQILRILIKYVQYVFTVVLMNVLFLVKSEKKFRQGKRESSKLSNFQIRTRLKRQLRRTFLQG